MTNPSKDFLGLTRFKVWVHSSRYMKERKLDPSQASALRDKRASPSEFRERGNNEIPLDRTIKTSCFADVLGALIIPEVGAEGGTRR
ncbi:hypothetical protein KQX54_005654 [Cotesia glomerata]|uniref:Uncharacterized protein n=1 Tax=Cotesia glomerata TaxID=32391 RepID=A0AAV7I7G9_COTGL|nr:hypothetical protein KQX54_005654 [Cotesia glomerata]